MTEISRKDVEVVKRTVLSNGLTVLWERMPAVRSVAVSVWFDAGVVHEDPRTNGVSHFLEHLVFRGTARRDSQQISREIDEVGGVLDGFTDHENTMFYVRVLDEHLELGLDLLSDVTINAKLDPDDLAKEKNVVSEEIRSYEDTPSDRIHDLICANLFPDKLLGLPVLGGLDTVGDLSPEDVRAYRDSSYHAGRGILCAAGNVDDRFPELAERYFGGLRPGAKAAPNAAEFSRAVTPAIAKDTEQLYLSLGAKSIPYGDPRRFVAAVLTTALGGNTSSRLFEKIRDRLGLAYSVYCYSQGYRETGAFVVYIGTSPGTAASARDIAISEVEDLVSDGLRPDELRRAKECLKGNLMLALEGTAARVSRLAKQELFLGRQVSLEETCEGVEAVTAEDVRRLVADIFSDGFTVVAIGPNADEVCGLSPGPFSGGGP